MLVTQTSIAYKNLKTHGARTLSAAAGICFAVFLLFLQWGLYNATQKEVTLLYEYFDYDLVVLSQKYQLLYSPDTFDRVRLIQSLSADSVKDSFNLNLTTTRWIDPKTNIRSSTLLIGIEDKPNFVLNHDLLNGLKELNSGQSILVDRFSHRDYGMLNVGTEGRLKDREMIIKGLFELGLFFYAEGSAVVKNDVFYQVMGKSSRATNVGLIQLKSGYDLEDSQQALINSLPKDVIVLTKQQLIDQERHYFISVKPIGMLFQSAMFIAFLTGVVVLFQIIATEIGIRLKEYATLKAMGFTSLFIYSIAIMQIILLCILAFIPAAALSYWVFSIIFDLTHLPVELNQLLLSRVFFLTLLMGFLSGLVSLYKLSQTDPAELY